MVRCGHNNKNNKECYWEKGGILVKKIVHICQSDIGGTTEYIYLLLKNMDTNKYQNILICPSSGNIQKKISKLNIKIYIIEMIRNISSFKDFKDILKIRKILKKEKPDVLFLHSSKAGALGRMARIGIKNLKVLYNPHGWAFNMEGSSKKKFFYGAIEKFLSYFTDIIINISEDEYETAIKRNISEKKMVIIKNGIEIEKYKENKKEIFLDKYVIGFVGRLSEQKNPLFLVEIAKELLDKKEQNFTFYVVGDGELRGELEKKIKENNLESYFFLRGWSEKVEEDIRNFDIALMISKWEGFGLVVCEYMAAKKPVIGVSVGGVKDIIENEKNGILIKEYDSQKFAENIIRIKNTIDLKEQLINKAFIDVKNKFSITEVIKRIKQLI